MSRNFLTSIVIPLLFTVFSLLSQDVNAKRVALQAPIAHGTNGGGSRRVLNVLENKYPLGLDKLMLQGIVERAERRRNAEFLLERRADTSAEKVELGKGTVVTQGDVMLESAVQVIPSITIFSRYIREMRGLSKQLSDEKENLLIFAPSDETISGLLVKPWEYPNNIEELEKQGASAAKIEAAIKDNIARFVLSHIVSKLDFQMLKDGSEVLLRSDFYPTKSTGGDILLRKEGSDYLVASAKDGDFVKVASVDTAVNGIVMIIDTCLSFD